MAVTALNPRTTSYEFFGPPGTLLVSLTAPLAAYALYFNCSEEVGGCNPDVSSLVPRFVAAVSNPDFWKSLFDAKAAIIYLAWYAFCVVSWAVLPGDWIEGVQIRDGKRKQYKINGAYVSLYCCDICPHSLNISIPYFPPRYG